MLKIKESHITKIFLYIKTCTCTSYYRPLAYMERQILNKMLSHFLTYSSLSECNKTFPAVLLLFSSLFLHFASFLLHITFRSQMLCLNDCVNLKVKVKS